EQAEQHDARHVLALADRRDHEVEEVARPRLLHEPGRDGDVRLVEDVHEQDARQHVGQPRADGPALLVDERADRPPDHGVDDRPHQHVEPAVPAALLHVALPAHDGAHALPVEPEPGLRLPRDRHSQSSAARCRNTSSRLGCPNCAATSTDVPLATTLPWEMNTTRSQMRSTSVMLWLVTSTALPYSSQISSRPRRARAATSGSSDAVGSSSTSSGGWCIDALTMPTSVRCPDDSSLAISRARWPMRKRSRPSVA